MIPIALYCSCASWRIVSRALFPWFVSMRIFMGDPSLQRYTPSEPIFAPACSRSDFAFATSSL